jgi:hypothetical protein
LGEDFTDLAAMALKESCAAAGVNARSAQLIRVFASAVYHLPAADAVARVARSTSLESLARIRTSLAVTSWLVEAHEFPTVTPLPVQQPIESHGCIVTFWRYLPQENKSRPSAGDLGRLLKELHRLPKPPISLPTYQPLQSVQRAISQSRAVNDGDRTWLTNHCKGLLDAYGKLEFELPQGMIHGDAWWGNLLYDGAQTVLADWDAVCLGAREIDHLPTLQAAARFGLPGHQREAFISAIDHDVTSWPGYPTLLAIREVSTLTALLENAHSDDRSRRELNRRIRSIQQGDNAQWTTF